MIIINPYDLTENVFLSIEIYLQNCIVNMELIRYSSAIKGILYFISLFSAAQLNDNTTSLTSKD
jgi:hypothetical protein